jgi:hypothetical protein
MFGLMQSPNPRDDHDRVFELIMAGWGSQAVRTLAALSVAEHLAAGPLSAADIAARESSDADMTYRVLRAGVALGLLEYDAEAALFAGTAMLSVLHEDSPVCLKHYAQAAISDAFWLPALRLPETVMRGENYVTEMLGSSAFEFLGEREDDARLFSAAMTDLSTPVIRDAVRAIDVADARSVVDIGGANGAFVAELLRTHPQLTGLVFDLPAVTPGVAEEARRLDLGERMAASPGDFFVEVPSADIYLLKFVLHDWDDAACTTILQNIRRAMNPGARVVIVEMNAGENAGAALMDLGMLHAFAGREREAPEFRRLLESAGLEAERISSLHPPYQLIEAVAA